MTFSVYEDREAELKKNLTLIYDALREKGYNPINQIVGYILSEDPTYITTYNNARSLIRHIDRDELLQVLIPEGERTVWGFSNSDAHQTDQLDTAFMDFILPEYSEKNLRFAMENGCFFSQARYAKNELGEDFKGEGTVPAVSAINVDYENQTITVKGAYCNAIEWVADGVVIKADTTEEDGEMTSVIDLNEYADKISCYVRCQLKGKGGILLTQAFICDKGDFEAIRRPIPDITPKGFKAKLEKKFFDTRLGVIINKINGKW
jgi:uncharacterized protein (UPF0297 family)